MRTRKPDCDMDEDCSCGAEDGAFCVYVAGPSADLPRARGVVRDLRVRGVCVIGDGWIQSVADGPPEAERTRAELAEAAIDDLGAVRGADLVLVLTSIWGEGTSGGATIEAGAALGLGRAVVTSGGPLHPLFRSLVTVECETDDQAVDTVAAIAVGWSLRAGQPTQRYTVGCGRPYATAPIVELDAAELPAAEPKAAPRVIRPQDMLAALGESPEVAAARAAGRAAVSRGGHDDR